MFRTNGWDGYRLMQTVASLSTLVLVLFGGISVWTTIVSNQSVTAEAVKSIKDDLHDTHTQLQLIQQSLTQVQIGLANKQDRRP